MASHKKLGEFFGKIPDVAFFSLTRVHSQYNLNSLLPLKSNRFFHPARTSAAGGISSSPLFAGLAEHSSPPSSIDRPKPVSHELDSHPSKEISPLKTLQASPQTCPGEVSLLSSPVEAERWEMSRASHVPWSWPQHSVGPQRLSSLQAGAENRQDSGDT